MDTTLFSNGIDIKQGNGEHFPFFSFTLRDKAFAAIKKHWNATEKVQMKQATRHNELPPTEVETLSEGDRENKLFHKRFNLPEQGIDYCSCDC